MEGQSLKGGRGEHDEVQEEGEGEEVDAGRRSDAEKKARDRRVFPGLEGLVSEPRCPQMWRGGERGESQSDDLLILSVILTCRRFRSAG